MDFRAHKRTRGRGCAWALATLTALSLAGAVCAPRAAAASYGAVGWGANLYRQLGDGSSEAFSDVPVAVHGSSGVSAVAAGGRHSLALLSNGTVMAWGDDASGQLGDGSSESVSSTPVAVSGLSGVVAIAAGAEHSLALLSNGTVMAWGANESGQLGTGNLNESDVPVAVKGLSGVAAIAAGREFSLALLKTGTVMAWGNNESGQLGDGGVKQSDVPVAVKGLSGVAAIAAGGEFSLALLKAGTAMAWGNDESGQLGEEAGEEGPPLFSDVPVAVHGLSGVSAVSAGGAFSLALLKGGTVMAWGADTHGQLGDGVAADESEAPVAVSGLSAVSAISAGEQHGTALLADGTVVDWGSDEDGILGDGSSGGFSDQPVAVSGLTGVVGVSAGAQHTLAFGAPIPTVTAIAPDSGPAAGGTAVKITGVELTGATAVMFGSSPAPSFTVESSTAITAVAPAGTGTVYVTVTAAAGTSAINRSVHFAYLPAPVVKKVSPSSGYADTTVTITGANFAGATAVMFGSLEAASFTVQSSTAITAVAPAQAAGTLDVTVVAPSGTSATSSKDRFKLLPAVTGVAPDAGSRAGGESVTITGAGFAPGAGATTFTFGSTKAKIVECPSTGECTVVVPAHPAGTVDVTATVGKLKSVKSPPGDQFTYG
jgi:IPT/TIG domain/Regulator of chromosome condensation (RCC1) repeat